MVNRETVEQLKAKLNVDLANTLSAARQIEGAIAACDKLLNDDDAEQAAAKAAKKKPK